MAFRISGGKTAGDTDSFSKCCFVCCVVGRSDRSSDSSSPPFAFMKIRRRIREESVSEAAGRRTRSVAAHDVKR